MRIDQLEALLMVSRSPSLSAASEQLHISVQTLSSSIKSLENELNLTLLERSSKGVIMTKEGLEVVQATQHFLEDMYKIRFKNENPQLMVLNNPLKLYVHAKMYELFVPRIICELKKNLPSIAISTYKLTVRELDDKLKTHQAPFALTFQMVLDGKTDTPDDFDFYPLFECKFVGIAQNNFPLTSINTISIKKLLKYPIIIYEDENKSDALYRLLHHFGKPSNLIVEKDFLLYREMLNAGLGIGFSIMTPLENYTRSLTESINKILLNDPLQLYGGYLMVKNTILSEEDDIFLRYIKNYLIRHAKSYPVYLF